MRINYSSNSNNSCRCLYYHSSSNSSINMHTLSQHTLRTITKHNSIAVIITIITTVTAIFTAQWKWIITIIHCQHKCCWHSPRSISLRIIITLSRSSCKNNNHSKAIQVITVGFIRNLNSWFKIHRTIIMGSHKRLIKRAMIASDNCNSSSNNCSHSHW